MQHVWIVMWLEVQNRNRPPIDRGTWQQMISYEMVNLPQKGEKPVMMEWRAPPFCAGNEWFNYEDSAGSLRRRTMTFLYDRKPEERRPDLLSNIKKARGPLLLKMMHSYALQLMLFPGCDWEKKLPVAPGSAEKVPIIGVQMAEFHQRAINHLDPLQSFINQEHAFAFGPDLCMSEAQFIIDYNTFRRDHLGRERARWTQNHYEIVFESHDITRGMGEIQDPSSGVFKTMPCLVGIAPRQTDDVIM